MLRFTTAQSALHYPLGRREWLRLGGLAGLSWTLPKLTPRRVSAADSASAAPGFGRAKSVIVVFASGGQSQIDMWDPKPAAPEQIRGAFGSIGTAVPGVLFGEYMPGIAQVADKFTVVRTMSHEDLDHGSAVYLALTGRYHIRRSANPPPGPMDAPCYSSVLSRVQPTRDFVHTSVHVNGPAIVPREPAPGQYAGLLGKHYDPFVIGDVTAGDLAVPGLAPQPELPALRLRSRESLLGALDRYQRDFNDRPAAIDARGLQQQAFEMLERPATRQAFELSQEDESLRNRYGRNRSGQACLLARRLVEAGVPLVTVIWNHNNRGQDTAFGDTDSWGWDTHNDIFYGLKEQLLPRFDLGFSALLEDLDERGLLDETLVICMGEFGRAPLVAEEKRFAGGSPGRKHWASVYSIVMAGAGVTRGAVIGASDEQGAYPVTERYGPWDVIATIFSALGIDPETHYTTPAGQQLRVCDGRVMEALYG